MRILILLIFVSSCTVTKLNNEVGCWCEFGNTVCGEAIEYKNGVYKMRTSDGCVMQIEEQRINWK